MAVSALELAGPYGRSMNRCHKTWEAKEPWDKPPMLLWRMSSAAKTTLSCLAQKTTLGSPPSSSSSPCTSEPCWVNLFLPTRRMRRTHRVRRRPFRCSGNCSILSGVPSHSSGKHFTPLWMSLFPVSFGRVNPRPKSHA